MMDTAVVTTDLDRLAERVEKAATLVLDLRAKLAQGESRQSELEVEKASLVTEKAELARRLDETTSQLQGNDPSSLVAEVAALKKEQREWNAERKDVATRVESLLRSWSASRRDTPPARVRGARSRGPSGTGRWIQPQTTTHAG